MEDERKLDNERSRLKNKSNVGHQTIKFLREPLGIGENDE